jgi:4-hydroxy-tetrahydrodipicolinate reductase
MKGGLSMTKHRIAMIGASGKMGRQIIKGLSEYDDIEIVGAVDIQNLGQDAGLLAGIPALGVTVTDRLAELLEKVKPDMVIDFTHKDAACKNIAVVLQHGVSVVAGTTGLTEEDLARFARLTDENNTSMFIAPNFSLGAVLMMKFAQEAAKYYKQAEIIEYHNDKKVDSPSGTAITTARKMQMSQYLTSDEVTAAPKLPAPRGGNFDGTQIHSVRLQSLVAHQEVLFSGVGELLTVRHDSFSRESFIPGIVLAVRKVKLWKGLIIGLEQILEMNA